jgi:hypothetical protein
MATVALREDIHVDGGPGLIKVGAASGMWLQ